ncbi:MAG: serine/threonine protein kinase [Myxococcaceae bacterium]|nr:serine/threonine protein kinase [Myxococcaceae bacterium]MBH2005738.1 serine/threonine protein kinase [Myxococcaceae bacterium]
METYQIERKIAAGGMAEVYLARDAGNRRVVLKKILPQWESDRDYRRMFVHEFELMSTFSSERIVRVIERGPHFAVLEYVEGLDWRVLSQYYIPQSVVNYLFVEALQALSLVHGEKIIHRDISPQNWMLSDSGVVKLLDFGIAKRERYTEHTNTGVLKGKYAYMSPEQAAGKSLSIQSDLFSMGVIFYELLTRQRLFKRETDFLTLKAIDECSIEFPEFLSATLKAILQKALARDCAQRFQSALEFQQALLQYGLQARQLATQEEVVQYLLALPKPAPWGLFESTRIQRKASVEVIAAMGALAFDFLGLCW